MTEPTSISTSYVALRHGGEPAWTAAALLRLSPAMAADLEGYVFDRGGEGRPRFAHLAAGGYRGMARTGGGAR